MGTCKLCHKTFGVDNWDKAEVLDRRSGPQDYVLTPMRTWHLESSGIAAYMVGNDLYCPPCYDARAEA